MEFLVSWLFFFLGVPHGSRKKRKRDSRELKDPQAITHTIDIQGLWLQSAGQISQAEEWEAGGSPLSSGQRRVRAAETPRGVYGFMSVGVIKMWLFPASQSLSCSN